VAEAEDFIKEAVTQGQKLSGLLDRVSGLCEARRTSKDRVLHWLQDWFVFQQGQNTTQNLTFNVPKGFDYEAARFNIYPEIRRVSLDPATQGVSDVVFRSTAWFTSAGALGVEPSTVDAIIDLVYASADGKTRRYQNAGFFVAQTFSDFMNINNQRVQYGRNECPAGLVFDPFYRLERGSTLTCRVTPVFSSERTFVEDDARVYEYRIRGVLEGYKRL